MLISAINLSVPLDISLCRKIIRDFDADTKTKTNVIDELKNYFQSSRPLCLDDKYKDQAYLLVDDMASLDFQISNINKLIVV